jgi:uncharacterized protein (TIGR00730 family)
MTPNNKSICVFCGSAAGLRPAYGEAARTLGRLVAEAGFRLVFGGGGHGLMGEVARAAREAGGLVTGIMPDFLRRYEMPPEWEAELVLTPDMQQRKTQLIDTSDAFIVLPGGPGTMDEFFEVLTLASLDQLHKPIVVIDVRGYFAPLHALMRHMEEEGFVHHGAAEHYRIAASPAEAVAIIAATPPA